MRPSSSASALSRSARWVSSSSTWRDSLVVLLLRERVHGAELLAAACQPLDPLGERLALLVRQRLGGGLRLEPQAAGEVVQLALRVRGGVAHLLCGHLRAGHGLARVLQPPVDHGLLLSARLQRRGGLLTGGGAGLELMAEGVAAGADRIAGTLEGDGGAIRVRGERQVALGAGAERREVAGALVALALDALCQPLLRAQVAEQLGAPDRLGAVLRSLAAAGDEPLGAACAVGGLGGGPQRVAERRLRDLPRGVGIADRRDVPLHRGARLGLLADGRLRRCNQLVAPPQLLEQPLGPTGGRLRELTGARVEQTPRPRHGDAAERLRQRTDRVHDPDAGEQPLGERRDIRLRAHELRKLLPSGNGGRGGSRGRSGGRRRGPGGHQRTLDKRAAPVHTGFVKKTLRLRNIADHGRRQPRAEHRGERELVPALHVQALGQRARSPQTAGSADELVQGGQLRAHLGGPRAGRLGGTLGLSAGGTGRVGGLLGRRQRRAALLGRRFQLCHPGLRRGELLLQPCQLMRQPLLAARVQRRQLALDRLNPVLRALLLAGELGVGGRLLLEHLHLAQPPLAALARRLALLAHPLQPHRDPLARRARRVQARLQLLAVARLGRERLLGLLAAPRDLAEQPLGLVALGAHGPRPLLRLGKRQPGAARGVARQRVARLQRLPLEPLVELRRLRLALQRPQPRACLALHVERAREVLLRPLQLQLRAPAALAVLPETRRLLDHQPPLPRARQHDLLDLALRDDRVHLLAEPRVGEHLDHVHEPAAGAVQAVLALAVPVQLAHDRDLGEVEVERAVVVVDHDLHLGGVRALDPVRAREDHVLHRLPADGQRRLLAERPQHRVGDVRLARSVRPHDDRHSRPELQLGPVGEGLEALHGDGTQVHRYEAATSSSASRACRAASCSAAFLVFPSPRPSSSPATSATLVKLRSCAGPSSDTVL